MKKILSSFALAALLTMSQSYAQENKVTPEIAELIKKHNLQQVDFDYVQKKVGIGFRGDAQAILIDARPALKYEKGTIPSSLNITDGNFENDYKQIMSLAKDKELIVFCAGYNCEKSPIVAQMLKKNGHTNVKVYSAGEPEWAKRSYLEIGTNVVKAYQENNSALLVDTRPQIKYLQETIPGSLSIPDTNLDKLIGRLPIDKNEKIVTFCAGYTCEKSNIVANKLYSEGYKNVSVYAAGVPAWKEAGLGTTSSKAKVKAEVKEKKPFTPNGAKLGEDEGSIDGEWLKAQIVEDKVPEYIQIVNVLSEKDFKKGHIKGSINIEADKLSAKELFEKLPKGKTIVFNCSAGARSIEAWSKLKKDQVDVSDILYFDANVTCVGENCKIEVNEPLGA
jgi:rhodanese-related sulfurtransferase